MTSTAPTITHGLTNAAGTAVVPDDLAVHRPTAQGWHRLLHGPVNLACWAVVAAYLLVGLASLLPAADALVGRVYSPDKTYAAPALRWTDDAGQSHLTPASWFGLDFQGRSVLYRTLYGARTALLLTVITSALSLSIGTVVGVTAGYFGGWVDDVITWVYSVLSTVPWLLLVIAVTYALQQKSDHVSADSGVLPRDLLIVILAMGLTDWVGLCRLVRGEVIKIRDLDFVAAGRALGLGEARILFRHVLPNVSHLIIITFTLGAVSYLQVEVVLAFLGLGVTSKPSWGRMIDDAKLTLLRGVWWEVVAATAAIFVICLALNLLGDTLRDALDPKLRGRN